MPTFGANRRDRARDQSGDRPPAAIGLDEAVELTRTGDVWVFRGGSTPDRAIRLLTNAPVNHVGMAVVLSDMPPLMWHAELGQSLVDVWTADHHRGAQLHDLRDAVLRWTGVYRQEAFLRQLHPMVDRDQEDALLRAIARYDGMSFPSTAQLAWRWTKGRGGPLAFLPERSTVQGGARRAWEALTRRPLDRSPAEQGPGSDARSRDSSGATTSAQGPTGEPANAGAADARQSVATVRPEAAYCAEVVALTYESMGILEKGRPANWYDPGRFWSGDELPLTPGWVFGAEIRVDTGPPPPRSARHTTRHGRRFWRPRRGPRQSAAD